MGVGGLGVGEFVVIFLVVALLMAPIFGALYFIRWQPGRSMRERQPTAGNSPEDTLRDRFARGEISEEELREMLQALRDSQAL